MHKCHIHCVHQILCHFTEAPNPPTETAATPDMVPGRAKHFVRSIFHPPLAYIPENYSIQNASFPEVRKR